MTEADSRRLCIDARMPETGGTGVATYARAVALAAASAGWRPARLRATEAPGGSRARLARWARAFTSPTLDLVTGDGGDLLSADAFRTAHVRFRQTGRILHLRAPGPPGVMHWTYPVPIRLEGWANLYTIHDAVPLLRPELTPIDRRRHRRLLDAIMRDAAGVLTVSAASRADIVTATACDPAMVTDCGQAVLIPPGRGALPPGLSPDGYLLFCGQIEPRKNLTTLIAAYRRSGLALSLVLAGPPGWRAAPILIAAAAAPGVVHLDYLPRETLVTLIASARALVLPSLSEGFGLPLAEAMALGTPALISRDAALVEVAGQAALPVDATDVAALADGLKAIAQDAALRARLRARGPERATAFSVEAFGRRLDTAYGRAFATLA